MRYFPNNTSAANTPKMGDDSGRDGEKFHILNVCPMQNGILPQIWDRILVSAPEVKLGASCRVRLPVRVGVGGTKVPRDSAFSELALLALTDRGLT